MNDLKNAAMSLRRSPTLSVWLTRILNACLGLTIFLIPLWFLPVTLDVLELNKQTLLVILMSVGLIAWVGKGIVEKSFTLSRSWVHLVVGLFLGGYLITSLFSEDRYLSLVGNFGQMQWAFTTVAGFVVFYLLIVNSVKDTATLYRHLLTFLASAALVGLYGLFQITGVFVLAGLSPITASTAFNTVGTINSLAVFMSIAVVLSASLLVLGCKDQTCVLGRNDKGSMAAKGLVWATLVLGLVIAILVDFWVVWAAMLFGTALTVGITFLRNRNVGHPTKMIVPGVLALLSILLLVWPTPIKLSLPAEVSPSASHSWQIARQTLQDAPLFGTGPGTWIYDYSKYRAPVVNLSQFWQIRFERGLSTFFSLLAMVGLVGTSLWLILVVSATAKSVTHLAREKNDDFWQAYLTIFVGWATTVFLAFTYNYNLSHHFAFWFLLALLGALVSKNVLTWDGEKKPMILTILSVKFVIVAVAAISITWLAGQRLVADAKYSQAVFSFREGKEIQASVDALNSAVALNRLNDAYYRNLSQAYLIRVSQELQGQPDEAKARLVNQLVSAAIDTGRRATEISPANVDNWANFAIIYQAIASFTRGADEFAIKNFEEALAREPNNPVFHNEIGKLYILRADAYRTLLSSGDASVRTEAEKNINAELEKAAAALNQAISAKGDYAPAHYNLGILYERQGRLKDAITKLEQVLSVSNRDVGVGFQLGILYYRNGEREKAVDIFEQIVALEPNYANARWYLSALYEEQGRYDDAIAQVERVRATNPGNTLVDQRIDVLQKARDEKRPPTQRPIPDPLPETIEGPGELNEVQQ